MFLNLFTYLLTYLLEVILRELTRLRERISSVNIHDVWNVVAVDVVNELAGVEVHDVNVTSILIFVRPQQLARLTIHRLECLQ